MDRAIKPYEQVKANRKALPESLEKCGCLDLGLSHEDITNYLIP